MDIVQLKNGQLFYEVVFDGIQQKLKGLGSVVYRTQAALARLPAADL
jgi:hypothetical protein